VRRGLIAGLLLVALAGAGATLSARAATASSARTSLTTVVYPDNPLISYTEYAHATISHSGAVFDRPGVSNGNAIASPGTRANFRTDATRVSIVVTYPYACGYTGCGRFAVEQDGRLLPASVGSDTLSGRGTFLLATQSRRAPHSYSVIWPYATQVVFDGLQIEGGDNHLLAPAPTRPARLYVAYGDSITQGYFASGTVHTYPDQVARKKHWSVVNMGFGGETTVPSDGTAVGTLGGSIVTVAIGVNDWGTSKPLSAFVSDYNGLLDAIRALQPQAPVYCLTPIWTTVEGVANSQGLFIQDIRNAITTIVQQRMATDPNVHLIDGLALVPNQSRYFVDGVHPNDAGFALYAANLAARLPS
jgi:lysophospholipase L1-like esterase